MEMHERTAYISAILSGIAIASLAIYQGDTIIKSTGAALMLSSAIFLFVGFFSKPQYEFGKSTIMFRASMAAEKLEELAETQHHKQIFGERIKMGIEEVPSKARLNSMLKPELVMLCIGLGLPSDPDLHTKKELIENIIQMKEDSK